MSWGNLTIIISYFVSIVFLKETLYTRTGSVSHMGGRWSQYISEVLNFFSQISLSQTRRLKFNVVESFVADQLFLLVFLSQ